MSQALQNIIFLILGILLGGWYTIFLKRPKLSKNIGSVGGGGFSQKHSTIGAVIHNEHGLIGFDLRPNTIFGRPINSYRRIGLPMERETAKKCMAVLYDRQSGESLGQLWWQLPEGKMSLTTSIESGESATLMVIARLGEEQDQYFIFKPRGKDDRSLAEPEFKFTGSMQFEIVVYYSGGRKLKIPLSITKTAKNQLNFKFTHKKKVRGNTF